MWMIGNGDTEHFFNENNDSGLLYSPRIGSVRINNYFSCTEGFKLLILLWIAINVTVCLLKQYRELTLYFILLNFDLEK